MKNIIRIYTGEIINIGHFNGFLCEMGMNVEMRLSY